jgi:hypothetical protein
MRMAVPKDFPENAFRKFGDAAFSFFPRVAGSDDDNRTEHFQMSWSAVRYRYRTCAECDEKLKALLAEERDWGLADEEKNYQLDRLVYEFFTNALSVFESFVFCLYFVGNAIKPKDFPIDDLKSINLKTTAKKFGSAFPSALITCGLAKLRSNQDFETIDEIRNMLAHRLAGGRGSSGESGRNIDGSHTEISKEVWLWIPGAKVALQFDEEMLQSHLKGMSSLLTSLISTATEFAENIATSKVRI